MGAERRASHSHRSEVVRSSERTRHTHQPCTNCGAELEIMHRPVRRLSWTRFWWRGVTSLFSQPLRHCTNCGSLYEASGTLVAPGATETETELKAIRFRNDMIGLRDGFGAVVLGSGMTVLWTLVGPITYEPFVTLLAGGLGAMALAPFGYFMMKVRQTKRQLKEWRKARRQGNVVQ